MKLQDFLLVVYFIPKKLRLYVRSYIIILLRKILMKARFRQSRRVIADIENNLGQNLKRIKFEGLR